MTVNAFALYLANRIQEYRQVTIEHLSVRTNRSPVTIRRTIHTLNEYLDSEQQFIVTDSKIISQMSYGKFKGFIQSLSIFDYSTTWEERLQLVLCSSMLNGFVNITKLYKSLEISQSTKKKDRMHFIKALAEEELELQSFPGKGIAISGEELVLRVKTAISISQIIELNENQEIIPRVANNPIQRLSYQLIEPLFSKKSHQQLQDFLNNEKIKFNYTSTKFLYVYYILSMIRIKIGYPIETTTDFSMEIKPFDLFESPAENNDFSAILSSLDNNQQSFYPENFSLTNLCQECINYVEERILTTFYSRQELQKELEQYLYKCFVRKELNYDFYDNKLDDIKKEFSFLYQLVEFVYHNKIKSKLVLDEYQIGTITLLFREHVLKNKIAGRNLKRVVLITNSAKEKSNFFSQQLIYYFDTEVIDILNINEIHQLKYLKFDNLITFSNRISTMLKENGYPNIKINYYFHSDDIEYLTKLNFSSNSHRKLVAEQFSKEIEKVPSNELESFLINNYSNFFV